MSEKQIAIVIVFIMFILLFANMLTNRNYEVKNEDLEETKKDL